MGVYKTDTGTWGYVVDLPKDRQGKRRQRRRQGFPTKKAAQAAYDRLRSDVYGQHVTTGLTVAEVADRWLAHLEASPDIQGSTVKTHRANLEYYLLPAVGHRDVSEVTAYDLEQVYAHARQQGVRGKPLSARTVETIHQTASAMWKRAVRWRLATYDPTSDAEPPRVTYDEKRALTVDDVRAFLTAVSARDDYALWYVAVVTGARVGELAALTWDRIDFDGWSVTFAEAEKTYDPEGRPFPKEPDHVTADQLRSWGKIGPVKNRRQRTIHLDAGAIAVLQTWQNRQAEWAEKWRWTPEWVWTWPYGARYKKQWIGKTFKSLLPDGVDATFHEIRHTAATLMLQAGIDVPSAAKRLGHDPNVMLRTYAHVLEEMDRRAGDTLGQLVQGD